MVTFVMDSSSGVGRRKDAFVQALVEQGHSCAVTEQDLDRSPPLAEEDEERAAAGFTTNALRDHAREAIEPPP